MDEKRKYFRIKNTGEMNAFVQSVPVKIVDISASSVAIITDMDLPQSGTIELKINLFSMTLDYEFFTTRSENITILLFPKEEQAEILLPVLKNLRSEKNRA